MSTTMFIPMPEWQAMLFLRDRRAAFQRLVLPLDKKDRSEVSAIPDERDDNRPVLFTYRKRADAIEDGYRAYPLTGFAMLRIVVPGFAYGNTLFRRDVDSESKQRTPLYKLSVEGINRLCEKCSCGDVEVMVDQIFPPGATEKCSGDPLCCKAESRDTDELSLPRPREVGMPSGDELDESSYA